MNVQEFRISQDSLHGLLFTPAHYDRETPLLVYLHGAGERGEDLQLLYRHAVPRMIEEGKEFDAIVLCPQCPENRVWNNVVDRLKELIDAVVEKYQIQPDRILLTGSSMGGYGTWEMGMTFPLFFAAIAPVAAGGMCWRSGNLRFTPVYAFHGTADEVVPYVYSQLMVDGVNRNGGNARLVPLEGLDHCVGINRAYDSTDMLDWLLKQRRTQFEV